MEPGESSYRDERRRFPVAFLAGLVVVFILFGAFFLLTRVTRSHDQAAVVKLPFGPAEQAYSARIRFQDIQLARASNFLKQEFTYVDGIISNDGVQTIRTMEVSVEFRDPFNQLILRDTRVVIGPDTGPLPAGQRHDFHITLEHIPAEWNKQYPSISVIGLVLQ
jgi:hypothetical protein